MQELHGSIYQGINRTSLSSFTLFLPRERNPLPLNLKTILVPALREGGDEAGVVVVENKCLFSYFFFDNDYHKPKQIVFQYFQAA